MSAAAFVGRLQMRVSTTSVGGRAGKPDQRDNNTPLSSQRRSWEASPPNVGGPASQPDQRYNNPDAAFVAMAKLGSFAS
ncbi:MAG: hypothetical protein IJR26_03760 [Bacteroidales bacterium]|nr:hypothetical protein [Bacteroidales bacterium]